MQTIGEFSLNRVIESEEPLFDAATFLPDSTPDVIEANREWLFPKFIDPSTSKLIITVQSYILKTPRYTILIDACVGNDKDRPARPMWHRMNNPYLADLAAAGVQPEEVDFVMCTHLHVDHVGWNTRLVDGRWVPTFPNAKYIFGKKELEFWMEREKTGEEGPVPNVYADSIGPVMDANQAVLVDMDHQFDNGIWFEPAPGHTPGNFVINLESGNKKAVLTGDVMHHPIQLARPEWSSRACEDRVQSAATRRALIERYADTDTMIAPAHFASPSTGHICSHGDHFRFKLTGG